MMSMMARIADSLIQYLKTVGLMSEDSHSPAQQRSPARYFQKGNELPSFLSFGGVNNGWDYWMASIRPTKGT